MIRALDPHTDAEAVLDLFARAADYIDFESGQTPDVTAVNAYFTGAPPGGDPATSLKLGLFEFGTLLGVVDLAFGYPEPQDAYLGLMLLAQEARGRGLGRRFLGHVEAAARDRGATRLLLLVLEGNTRAYTFWTRQGFGSPKVFSAARIGARTHVRTQLEKPL